MNDTATWRDLLPAVPPFLVMLWIVGALAFWDVQHKRTGWIGFFWPILLVAFLVVALAGCVMLATMWALDNFGLYVMECQATREMHHLRQNSECNTLLRPCLPTGQDREELLRAAGGQR